MIDLRGKRALVMGLGIHGGGLGVARFLVGQGADVTITDLRGPDLLKPSLEALASLPIRYVLGEHREEDFRAADLVIRNPGVPRESRYLQVARAAGAAIEMEMTLFFRLCPGPIIGITGTKGKTTTTLLTGAMLREQYPDTVVAGNLRISAVEALPQITAETPVVLELSSWQLEGLGEAQLSPQYACITNISADHLDRYGSMEAYIEAKRQIFAHQDEQGIAVYNRDDRIVAKMSEQALNKAVWFSERDIEPGDPVGSNIGYWRHNELIWRKTDGELEVICTSADVRLPGQHNRANIAAATALAKSFGVATSHIRAAIRGFTGVEHRLEFVRQIDGVRYINDTTATAPEAAIAALRSFDAPLVLIAGGADKNLPFDALAREIRARAKALVLLAGTATPKLAAALHATTDDRRPTTDQIEDRGLKIEDSSVDASRELSSILYLPSSALSVVGPFEDFAAAITAARGLAVPGDVVLLSPGCASFGMFRNEFHRGEEFRRITGELEIGD